MLNRMYKDINHLSMPKLLGMERKEHGLRKNPTKGQLATMEMKEHGLKKKPSMGQLLKMESKEHRKDGEWIIGRGHEGNARKSNGKMR